jgi:glutamyl endopeptidase
LITRIAELIQKVTRLLPDFYTTEPSELSKIINSRLLLFKSQEPLNRPYQVKLPIKQVTEATMMTTIEKIRRDGTNANFTPPEILATCSIILTARPALLIQDGKFEAAPCLGDVNWNAVLGNPPDRRDEIEKATESVGRIEFLDSDGKDWNTATGFLVAKDVMMTNSHVASYFCYNKVGTEEWTFQTGCKKRRIDYKEEPETTAQPTEFKIKKILKIYDQNDLDLALFKVAQTSHGNKHPEPLVLANQLPDPVEDANARPIKYRNVYAIGYPSFEGDATKEELDPVFKGKYGVKRLQPGTFREVHNDILYHDCSTIYGNSGSCIIDIGEDHANQVIGLHFDGDTTRTFNKAIALPLLDESIKSELKQFGIKFA